MQAVAPNLVSTEPAAEATEVALVPAVRAHFDADLDATSIGGAIMVVDIATQLAVEAETILASPRVLACGCAAAKIA